MFDPTYPPNKSEINSAPLRDQFNALKTLIDALPTQTELNSAIATTPNSANTVGTLAIGISNPPTQMEVQQIVNKIDELINTLYRF